MSENAHLAKIASFKGSSGILRTVFQPRILSQKYFYMLLILFCKGDEKAI